jgi:hypothetical protein
LSIAVNEVGGGDGAEAEGRAEKVDVGDAKFICGGVIGLIVGVGVWKVNCGADGSVAG